MRILSSSLSKTNWKCLLLFGALILISFGLYLLGPNFHISSTLLPPETPKSEISTFEPKLNVYQEEEDQNHHHDHDHQDEKFQHVLNSNISIVVHLNGEMGNQLSRIASGFTVQQDLLKRYNITSHLVLRHQNRPKWIHAKTDVQNCFPNTRLFDFSAGNTQDFDIQNKRQEETYGLSSSSSLWIVDPTNDGLEIFYNIIKSKNESTAPSEDNIISLPFLQVKEFSRKREEYYDEIRNFFQFDFESCCAEIPDEEEAVFHLRNFIAEMPRTGKYNGFEELDATRTANELLGHLHPKSDKVAMLSRSDGNIILYEDAFRSRGLQFRFITEQNGTQDFCFLLRSQADIAGSGLSTFFTWAVWLRNYTKPKQQSWVYWIDSKQSRQHFSTNHPDHPDKHRNFTFHPELASRIHYITFNSSDENA